MFKTAVVTSSTAYAVSLEDIKDHLRLEPGYTDEDDYLKALRLTAQTRIERLAWLRLNTQTLDLYLDRWPHRENIEVPYGKLQSVTSVTYRGTSSTAYGFTLASSAYTVDTVSELGRIVLKNDEDWPTQTLSPDNPIKVRYICGYSGSTSVPEPLKMGIKLLVSHMYENREPYSYGMPGQKSEEVPMGIKNLIADYRLGFPV